MTCWHAAGSRGGGEWESGRVVETENKVGTGSMGT